MSTFPEPASGLWMWLDSSSDPFAIFVKNTSTNTVPQHPDDCWFNADQWADYDSYGMAWADVLHEMDGFDGPHELVRADGKAVTR